VTANGSNENGPSPLSAELLRGTSAGVLVAVTVLKWLTENSLINPDYVLDLLRQTIQTLESDGTVPEDTFAVFRREINGAIELIRAWTSE
jgi:hypothetical protein